MVHDDYCRHVDATSDMQSMGFAMECMMTVCVDGSDDNELPELIACLAREQLSKIQEVRDFAANELQADLMLITARARGASLMITRWLNQCSDMPHELLVELPEAILKLIKNNNITITSLLSRLESD